MCVSPEVDVPSPHGCGGSWQRSRYNAIRGGNAPFLGQVQTRLPSLWNLELAAQYLDVTCEVVATDIDPHVLERAERGCYSMSSLKDFPQAWLAAAFTEADDELCVKPEFRGPLRFLLQDIREELPHGTFQLALCRHVVFTYFEDPLQQSILQRILTKLVPGGILATGKQEPLPAHPANLREYAPNMGIYRLS